MSGGDRAAWEIELAAIEAELARGDADLDRLAERALLLARLGRIEEAKAQYLEVLQKDPGHFAALNNLGTLLSETGYRTAARTVFAEAVRRHPDQPTPHANLADLFVLDDELDEARAHYEAALRLDPLSAPAHQRLSALLHELGDVEGMRRHRALGFGMAPMESLPYLGAGEPVPLLVLTSMPAGDISWRKLVDQEVFAVTALAAAFHPAGRPLPPHRLVFNVIGDADLCPEDLDAAGALVARTSAPVINPPDQIVPTTRAAGTARLGGLPGVLAPRTVLLPRKVLEGPNGAGRLAGEGLGFPLLLRSPGFHTGRHFVRVETAAELAPAVDALPGPELMAIEALDARGPDGLHRKYRVMMIGGRLYPLHLAISRDWKVHYFSGAMAEDEALRAEEARFLGDMTGTLGPRAMQALEAIQETLDLDYGGVDFGVGGGGDLLLFEANAVMNILPPGPDATWDYRRPAAQAALAAARAMLAERAAATGA